MLMMGADCPCQERVHVIHIDCVPSFTSAPPFIGIIIINENVLRAHARATDLSFVACLCVCSRGCETVVAAKLSVLLNHLVEVKNRLENDDNKQLHIMCAICE